MREPKKNQTFNFLVVAYMAKQLKTIVENISYKTCMFKSGLDERKPHLPFSATFFEWVKTIALARCSSMTPLENPSIKLLVI